MNGIITRKSKTSESIAQELGIPSFLTPTEEEYDTVIRWGTTALVKAKRVINKAETIRLVSDKAQTRRLLAENGISVPQETETLYPVVGRARYHSQGRRFFYCKNERDVRLAKKMGAVYFSQYYPKTEEYRFHIAGGKWILGSIKEGDKTQIIWNKRRGFTFKHLKRSVVLNNETLYNAMKCAKTAVNLVRLDFGAVDVMTGAVGDYMPFVITEINTAPSLSPLGQTKYCKYFRKLLDI